MISSINNTNASFMTSQTTQSSKLSTEQSDFVTQTLSEYDAQNLSTEDAQAIQSAFEEQGIEPTQELAQLMAELEFDAQSIGDAARSEEGQRPPPPPQNSLESVDTEEVVSYLDELLGQYSEQLNDEDKESILASVQEKFGLSESDSLLSVTA